MTSKQIIQYRCDFCGKKGLSKGHMKRHENSCTLNPKRSCGICKNIGVTPVALQKLMVPLLPIKAEFPDGMPDEEAFKLYDAMSDRSKEAISQIRDASGGCPACILAALRQSGIPMGCFSDWKYKKEHEQFWHAVNEERRDD